MTESSRVVSCRYCGAANRLRELKTLAQQTPPEWKPPPEWRPPPSVPAHRADAAPLVYQPPSSGGALGVVVALTAVVGIGAGGAFFASRAARGGGLLSGLDPQRLATIDVSKPSTEVAKALGVPTERLGHVAISHPRFVAVGLNGGDGRLEGFYAHPASDNKSSAKVRERVEKRLGRPFEKDAIHCPGLNYGVHEGGFNVNVSATDQTPWEKQREVAWKIFLTDALEVTGLEPSAADVAAYACGGHPLKELARLDLEVDIDGAQKMIRARFPGASREQSGTYYRITLSHPLFTEASLSWANEKGGKATTLWLNPRGLYSGEGRLDVGKVAACLRAVAGEGKESVTDYAKGERSFDWDLSWVRMSATRHQLLLTLRSPWVKAPPPPARFTALVEALDACR